MEELLGLQRKTDTQPGVDPLPVDVLREFFATGNLPAGYAVLITVPGGVGSPLNGVTELLNSIGARPCGKWTLRVRPDSFGPGCTVLESLDALTTYSLVEADGVAFAFAEFFLPLPGTLIQVEGYGDAPAGSCASQGIEVTSATLLSVPAVTLTDSDGDLLLDDLEWALFGSLGQSGCGDADGDSISTAQEVLEGNRSEQRPQFRRGAVVHGASCDRDSANRCWPVQTDLELADGFRVETELQRAGGDESWLRLYVDPALSGGGRSGYLSGRVATARHGVQVLSDHRQSEMSVCFRVGRPAFCRWQSVWLSANSGAWRQTTGW